MFNNIIYFIIVILIFSIYHPEKVPKETFPFFLTMLSLTWVVFAAFCRWGFRDILKRFYSGLVDRGHLLTRYHQRIARLFVLSIFLFALDVYLLNLKYWIQKIPWAGHLSFLQSGVAFLLFFTYLATIWHFAHPAYGIIFGQSIPRRSFIRSNIRLNIPIIFPWMLLSLIFDLLALSPWGRTDGFLTGIVGNLIFFAGFMIFLMIYMPGIIRFWWGCKPLSMTEKVAELKSFLSDNGFKYRHLLKWPIFEGRMMTAGIMGIVAKYRYILITDSLMEILTTEELKAVLAHEMGHVRYRHLLFYVLFLLGFMVISFSLQDVLQYGLYMLPSFMQSVSGEDSQSVNLYYLTLSFPMLVILIVYFRYVMGFFMRNFERQADLYSATLMGTPAPTISALEKIAYFSGKTMDVPSWHHFSIRERIKCLMRTLEEPGLLKRHSRFISGSFLIYLVCTVGLGYILNFSLLKKHMMYSIAEKILNEQILEKPDNILFYQDLAMVCHEMEEYEKAISAYEKVIALDANQAVALNNLAWILATCPDEKLRDKHRALALAKRAVALERSAVFLDTLAEAYYLNGFVADAVETIKKAISVSKDNRNYYEKQLKRFKDSL